MEHPPISVRFLNPPTLPQPVGYSQVAETRGGKTVYISGQVALDPAGQLVGPDDARAQTQQVFENLGAALTAVGCTWDHVVKLTYYLIDIKHLPVVREVRNQYINLQQPPASSLVEIRRLFRDDCLIEIDAIAVVPDQS